MEFLTLILTVSLHSPYNVSGGHKREAYVQLYSIFNLGDRWGVWLTPRFRRFVAGNDTVPLV